MRASELKFKTVKIEQIFLKYRERMWLESVGEGSDLDPAYYTLVTTSAQSVVDNMQIIHPVIVCKRSVKGGQYELLGGVRTYLLSRVLSEKDELKVLVVGESLGGESFLYCDEMLSYPLFSTPKKERIKRWKEWDKEYCSSILRFDCYDCDPTKQARLAGVSESAYRRG